MYSLNENIKRLRLQYGMNQVEFAQKMGVSKQCVSNWENDNVLPSIEMLVKLADYFGVTTDCLLGRTSDKTISVDGLTDKQCSHISLIIKDFLELNNKGSQI